MPLTLAPGPTRERQPRRPAEHGHRRSTSPSIGSAGNKSSVDSHTSTRSPHDMPRALTGKEAGHRPDRVFEPDRMRSAPGGRARTCHSACCATGCCSRPPASAAPAPRRSAECTSRTWTCARMMSTPPPRQGRHRPHPAARRPGLRRAAQALPGPVLVRLGRAVPGQHQRPGRAAVLRRGAQPVEEVLRRRRHRDRHPPTPPRACHRVSSERRVHRGRPPPPRSRFHRDHPGQNCSPARSPTTKCALRRKREASRR